jgi:hypothetical protein
LIGDGGVGNQAQDLAVSKCFAAVHREVKICTHLYIYTGRIPSCQRRFEIFSRRLAGWARAERKDS